MDQNKPPLQQDHTPLRLPPQTRDLLINLPHKSFLWGRGV